MTTTHPDVSQWSQAECDAFLCGLGKECPVFTEEFAKIKAESERGEIGPDESGDCGLCSGTQTVPLFAGLRRDCDAYHWERRPNSVPLKPGKCSNHDCPGYVPSVDLEGLLVAVATKYAWQPLKISKGKDCWWGYVGAYSEIGDTPLLALSRAVCAAYKGG